MHMVRRWVSKSSHLARLPVVTWCTFHWRLVGCRGRGPSTCAWGRSSCGDTGQAGPAAGSWGRLWRPGSTTFNTHNVIGGLSIDRSTTSLSEMTFGRTKGGKLYNVITYNVIQANQKTESVVYRWLRVLIMFDITRFPAFCQSIGCHFKRCSDT